MKTWVIRFFGIFLTTQTALAAADKASDYSYDNQWNSTETSTLGSIGTMSENFVDRFFANPATLNFDDRGLVFQWLNLNVNYTRDTAKTISDLQDTFANSNKDASSKSAQIIDALDALESVFGRRLGGGISMALLGTKIKNVAIIPHLVLSVDADARIPSWPELQGTADVFAGVGVGYAHEINDEWTVGASLRPGYRYYATAAVSSSDLGSDITGGSESTLDNLAKYGGAIYAPLDIGAIYTTPVENLTAMTTIHNLVGGTAMGASDTAPPDYPIRFSLGAQYVALQMENHTIEVANELQDIVRLFSDKSAWWFRWQWAGKYRFRFWGDRMALGANLGWQAGYGAAGLFADLWLVKLEVGTYFREAGTYPGQKSEQRLAAMLYTETSF